MKFNFYGSINLLKLQKTGVLKLKNKEGVEVEGVFIPLKENGLSVYHGERSTSLNIPISGVLDEDQNQQKNNGWIKKTAPNSETRYKDMTDAQKAEVNAFSPILGSLYLNQNSSASTEVYDAQIIGDEDGLAF